MVLWPLSTPKNMFSSSVWGQRGALRGAARTEAFPPVAEGCLGGCLRAELHLSFGNGGEQRVLFLYSAPGTWRTV